MLKITVENEPTIESPSLDQLRAVVNRMTPNGGPGFAVLEGRGDDYAQIAGGDGVFTAEWREYTASGFHHWKAGLPGEPTEGDVAVATNGRHITVHPNERLTASDAVAILGAFLAGDERPSRYVWREMKMQSPLLPTVIRRLSAHHYELPCRVCGETAVVMRVAVRGSVLGDEPRPHLVYRGITHEPLPGLHIAHSEPVFRWLEAADLAAVHAYLMKVDVRMDGGLDAYCPECNAIYCATHYRTRVEFDDEFAGFYDCTRGTCPRGHTRILDD